MADEREKGRIAGWLARLEKTLAFAEGMVATFEEMHDEAPATLRGYADWLNARDHKNERGRVWRAETVSRMFAIDQRGREIADKAFRRELERRRVLRLDRSGLEAEKRAVIARAEALAERLRGSWEPVVDRTKD